MQIVCILSNLGQRNLPFFDWRVAEERSDPNPAPVTLYAIFFVVVGSYRSPHKIPESKIFSILFANYY